MGLGWVEWGWGIFLSDASEQRKKDDERWEKGDIQNGKTQYKTNRPRKKNIWDSMQQRERQKKVNQ